MKKTVGIFLVSLIKWDKKYYLVCNTCQNGFLIKKELEKEVIRFYSELSDSKIVVEIYKKLKNDLIFYINNYKYPKKDFSLEKMKIEILNKKWDFSKKDIEYIYPIVLNDILKSIVSK